MENSWADAQAGGGVLLTSSNQEGSCTYCITQDVTFSNNVVKNIGMAVVFVGHQGLPIQPATMSRLYFYNNLFYPSMRLFSFFKNATAIWFENNTGFAEFNSVLIEPVEAPFANYLFRGNIIERPAYGVGGADEGKAFLDRYFPGNRWENNAVINSSEGTEGEQATQNLKPKYPVGTILLEGRAEVGFSNLEAVAKDHHGFELAPNSPLKKALPGGKDYGVDFKELDSKLPSPIF